MWGAEGRGWGGVQVFTVPLCTPPDYTVPRPEGRAPALGFLVVFLALLSEIYDALPAPFPDNTNAVLNPVVQARWGPGQCAHLRPLPSSPVVGGWRAACSDGWEQVVTCGGTEALRSSGLHPTPPRIPESPPPKSVWARGGGGWGLRGPRLPPSPAPVLFPGNVMLRKGQVWAPGPALKLNLPELLNSGEG